jgi:mono/diheme cytochrome c family protein
MNKRIRVSVFACWVSFLLISRSVAGTSAGSPSTLTPPERGAAIFRKSCSICHGIHKGETKMALSLNGELRPGSGHSEQSARQIIVDGRNNMPSFKEKINSRQMDDLIAYLKTL